MAVGHTAFDAWPVSLMRNPILWVMPKVFRDGAVQLGVVSNINLSGIARSLDVSLNSNQSHTLRQFTDMLEVFFFGIPAPNRPFMFEYVIVNQRGEISWDDIKKALSTDFHENLFRRGIPAPPFIVTQTLSNRSYQVKCVLDESPVNFMIPINQFGPDKQAGGQLSLCDFYAKKYQVTLDHKQPILICCMGSPICPDPPVDTPSLATPKTKKADARSQVYLVPQVVTLHPLTQHIHSLNRIPRLLFQLEAGLIAKRVSSDLFISEDNQFREYRKFFLSENPSYFFDSTMLELTAVALTRPSAAIAVDYQTLEWLGDAVFRFVLALVGMKDKSIRSNFCALMSNGNIGRMAAKSYPALPNSYVLSKPPSLKTPEQCRERLKNLNILADVAEALMAVSFLSGGVKSVMHTIKKLGSAGLHESLIGVIPETPSEVEAFRKGALKPAVIRLQASLQLLKHSDRSSMDVGELDVSRQLVISSLSKRGVETLDLYRQFCLEI